MKARYADGTLLTSAPAAPGAKPEAANVEAVKVEAFAVRPEVGLKLEDYLKQHSTQLLVSGSLGLAGTGIGSPGNVLRGLTPLSPLSFGPNLHLRPYTAFTGLHPSVSVKPGAKPAVPASRFAFSAAKTVEVVKLMDAFSGPIEQLAKTHSSLETPLDVLGFVVATPQVWKAMTKPGAKNKTEVVLAGAQAGVWFTKMLSDFVPALHPAVPTLVWTGVLLRAGEQVHAILHKPETKR